MSGSDAETGKPYATSGLLARLESALRDDGIDPAHPTIDALAPYDHFHGRGLEATEDMAALHVIQSTDHLLDVGSGLGGPARWLSARFGCRVTGIDLTPEFCAIAEHLTRLVGLEDRVHFRVGNALAMPFGDATFDGAFSMFVSMNIEDKTGLYREIRRVLRPNGWLVLSEVARGTEGDVSYPMPWAVTPAESFLATVEGTRTALQAAGFEIGALRTDLQRVQAFAARSQAAVESGQKPPYRANALINGEAARTMVANVARAYQSGSLIPIEVVARAR